MKSKSRRQSHSRCVVRSLLVVRRCFVVGLFLYFAAASLLRFSYWRCVCVCVDGSVERKPVVVVREFCCCCCCCFVPAAGRTTSSPSLHSDCTVVVITAPRLFMQPMESLSPQLVGCLPWSQDSSHATNVSTDKLIFAHWWSMRVACKKHCSRTFSGRPFDERVVLQSGWHAAQQLVNKMAIRCIKGITILDMDGRRVCAKYFDPKLSKDEQQRQFESKIFAKTKNMSSQDEAEVIMLAKNIVVFRNPADVFFYVIGDEEGNELIYAALLDALFDVRFVPPIARLHLSQLCGLPPMNPCTDRGANSCLCCECCRPCRDSCGE